MTCKEWSFCHDFFVEAMQPIVVLSIGLYWEY